MIVQPTNDVPFTEDLTKKYDKAKNLITLAEAEVARLRDLRVAEETTIIEKNKQKVYAEEQLNTVLANLAYSEEELAKNTSTIASQMVEIDLQRTQKEELANSLTERENACGTREKQIVEQEYVLNTRSKEISERTNSVEERENNVTERENKIKDLCSTLA